MIVISKHKPIVEGWYKRNVSNLARFCAVIFSDFRVHLSFCKQKKKPKFKYLNLKIHIQQSTQKMGLQYTHYVQGTGGRGSSLMWWSSTFCLCLFMMSTNLDYALLFPSKFPRLGFCNSLQFSSTNLKLKKRDKYQINEDHTPLSPTRALEVKYSRNFLKNIFTNSVSRFPCSPMNLFGLFKGRQKIIVW